MGASAIKSHGTIVARQTAGVGGFTDIGELTDITAPPLTRNPIEALSQTDDDDYYVVGLRRTGEFTFGINFNPTLEAHDHVAGLIKSWNDGALDGWRITWTDADASTLIFSGYVTNIAPTAPIDGITTAQVTIRPTGVKAFANNP